jgi:hypothetical protein
MIDLLIPQHTYPYIVVMKAVTINIDESVYEAFKKEATERKIPAAELIREAMRRFAASELATGPSLADLKPMAMQPRAPLDLSTLDEEMLDDRA